MSRLVSRGLTALAMAAAAVATSLVAAAPAQAASYYNLVNYKSGLCMSVAGGGSTANGAHVIQWGCNDGWEQVLSVDDGGSTAQGAHVIQWTSNGGSEQGWAFYLKYEEV